MSIVERILYIIVAYLVFLIFTLDFEESATSRAIEADIERLRFIYTEVAPGCIELAAKTMHGEYDWDLAEHRICASEIVAQEMKHYE